jgi:hypothetical protein
MPQIYNQIRHSSEVIRTLPLEYRGRVTSTYGQGVKLALSVSTGLAAVALVSSFWAKGVGLKRSKEGQQQEQEQPPGDIVP